jgi:hypothetical protein
MQPSNLEPPRVDELEPEGWRDVWGLSMWRWRERLEPPVRQGSLRRTATRKTRGFVSGARVRREFQTR